MCKKGFLCSCMFDGSCSFNSPLILLLAVLNTEGTITWGINAAGICLLPTTCRVKTFLAMDFCLFLTFCFSPLFSFLFYVTVFSFSLFFTLILKNICHSRLNWRNLFCDYCHPHVPVRA